MMKTNELLNHLKVAIQNKTPLRISLDNCELGTFKFDGEKYQGMFGCLELENLLEGINDGWLIVEIIK